jgi:hypothetical protein
MDNKVMYGALITEIDKLGDKHSRNNEPKEWLEMQISKKCNKTKQIPTDEVGSCPRKCYSRWPLPLYLQSRKKEL